jgi:hypothetical protein
LRGKGRERNERYGDEGKENERIVQSANAKTWDRSQHK